MHRSTKSLLHKSISLYQFHHKSQPSPQFPLKTPPSRILTKQPNPLLFRTFCINHSINYNKDVDEINLKFAEAREEIDAALESKETVYFDEEAECAREAVQSVFEMFDELLVRLPERERLALQRSMGLKMEQLKAELKQLDD